MMSHTLEHCHTDTRTCRWQYINL